MSGSTPRTLSLAALVGAMALVAAFETYLFPRYHSPFPPLAQTLGNTTSELQDFVGIGLGVRRLAADIAWIETLTYYGTDEQGLDETELENGKGSYPLLLPYCQRTVRLDPHFNYAYYYCAGALGWNLGHLDDAQTFLKEGIKSNPLDWRLSQYLAAMAFQKDHDPAQVIAFLHSLLFQPDCPNLLRSILANLYKKQKQYREAVGVWVVVLNSKDPAYVDLAESQIQRLLPLIGSTPTTGAK